MHRWPLLRVDMRACNILQGKNENEKKKFAEFFSEVQKVVDSKQLRPMIRTQYMRTAFQVVTIEGQSCNLYMQHACCTKYVVKWNGSSA
jgi:VTC domain